jgi:hypothetical protein
MLERDRWWFGSRTKFDDSEDMFFPGYDFEDPEIERRAREENQEFMNNTGVLCLSVSAKQPRLWREYAAAGKGICIKLESDYIVHPDNGPFRVRYSDDPKPLWKAFQDNPDPLVYLLQKEEILVPSRGMALRREMESRRQTNRRISFDVEQARASGSHIWLECDP